MAYQLAIARSRRHVPASRREPAGTAGQPGRTFPNFTYIICTTPRSGSWLLSEGLASTSRAAIPANGSTSSKNGSTARSGAWSTHLISRLPSTSGSLPGTARRATVSRASSFITTNSLSCPRYSTPFLTARTGPRRHTREGIPACPLHLADPARQGAAGDLALPGIAHRGVVEESRGGEVARICGRSRRGEFRPLSRPPAGEIAHRQRRQLAGVLP